MLASLTAALVAALCYGIASVMQSVAAHEASNRPPQDAAAGGVDPGLLPRMFRQWRFILSLCLDALGFLAQLVALQRLPLFAVQAIVAANLAVTAVLASLLLKVPLSWREWCAVTGVVAGVGLLGSSAGPEGATQAATTFKVALIVTVAALGLCGLAAAKLVRGPARTLVLGTVAGFGYGVVGIAARVLNGFEPLTLIRDPAAYAVAAAGIVAFVFYATALEGGSVTVATAAVVLAETLPPAVIGVVFLGDMTRPGLKPVAVAGFLLAVVSAVMLARFGEADHAARGAPGHAASGAVSPCGSRGSPAVARSARADGPGTPGPLTAGDGP